MAEFLLTIVNIFSMLGWFFCCFMLYANSFSKGKSKEQVIRECSAMIDEHYKNKEP